MKKEKEHKTDGTKCWCNPIVEDYSHNVFIGYVPEGSALKDGALLVFKTKKDCRTYEVGKPIKVIVQNEKQKEGKRNSGHESYCKFSDIHHKLQEAKSQGAREALETVIEEVKSRIGQHCGKEDCNQGQCINRHIKDDVLKEVLSILQSNNKEKI